MTSMNNDVRDLMREIERASGAEVMWASAVVGEYIAVHHPSRPDETLCFFSLPKDDEHEIPDVTDDMVSNVVVHIIRSGEDETTVTEDVTLPVPQLARIAAAWSGGASPADLVDLTAKRLEWIPGGLGFEDARSGVYPRRAWSVGPDRGGWKLDLITDPATGTSHTFGTFPSKARAMDIAETTEAARPTLPPAVAASIRLHRAVVQGITPTQVVRPEPPPPTPSAPPPRAPRR